MPKLKAEFEDGNLTIPRHADVQDDLGKIQVINGIPKIDKGRSLSKHAGQGGQQRHGDFAVALAMAVGVMPSEIEALPILDADYSPLVI